MRWRSVVHVLSTALLGHSIGLWDFPTRREVTGVGLSDWPGYAEPLSARFAYRNTYFDREPLLDITDPPRDLYGTLDFLISSDVFEHVEPPVERAFENSFRLLKPGGVFVVTVPYSTSGDTDEHYADLNEYEIVDFKDRRVLVNRTVAGDWEVFDNLVFHGGDGATLEMRLFSRDAVLRQLRAAGFADVALNDAPCPEFGIVWPEPWGLPFLARR